MFFGSKKLENELEEKNALVNQLKQEISNLKVRFKKELKSLKKEHEKTLLELRVLKEEYSSYVHKVEASTDIDVVSGAHNKRYFYDIVESMISLSKRDKSKLSLVVVNVDKYDKMDEQSPLASKVLQDIVHRMSDHIRESDLFVRFERAKFVIVLPKTSLEQANLVCEKLKNSVAKEPIGEEFYLSLSTGVVEFMENENVNHALTRAQELLKVS